MRIEMMKLSEAIERRHTKNPKEHNVEALIASFVRFGFKAAPTIDETSGIMVAGHGRCIALDTMRRRGESPPNGIEERIEDGAPMWWLPVVRDVSFESDSERDAYVIADNQHVIAGGWNIDALQEMLGGLDGFEGLGFEAADLSAFGIGSTIGGADDDDSPHAASDDANEHGGTKPTKTPTVLTDVETPEPPKEPITKPGDTWKLGDSLLICGDCTQVDPSRLVIGRVGFGFTSPPYNAGSNRLGGNQNMVAAKYLDTSDSLDDDTYAELLNGMMRLLLASCQVACVNIQSLANNKRVVTRWAARFVDHLADRAIWAKINPETGKINSAPAMSAQVMNSAFEDVFIFAQQKNPSRAISTSQFRGTVANIHSGVGATRDNEYASIHAATMPMHLAQFGIEQLGSLADFVVDPFGGTGTTLIVAEQLGKRGALVEMSPAYCDVIVERWKKLTGGSPHRVSR